MDTTGEEAKKNWRQTQQNGINVWPNASIRKQVQQK